MAASGQQSSILDRPIGPKKPVAASSWCYLFSELVAYSQARVQKIADLERKLEEAGHGIGVRMLELFSHRDRAWRRETRLVQMLQFVSSVCWKNLYGKAADALEKSTGNDDEYLIHELDPLPNRFISVPRDLGTLNCAAFNAGLISGILDAAGLTAKVTAHNVAIDGEPGEEKTVYLIKFEAEVKARDTQLR